MGRSVPLLTAGTLKRSDSGRVEVTDDAGHSLLLDEGSTDGAPASSESSLPQASPRHDISGHLLQ